jgi:hypothetical protein
LYAQESEAAARAMLEWIDADVLPQDYGGENTAGEVPGWVVHDNKSA